MRPAEMPEWSSPGRGFHPTAWPEGSHRTGGDEGRLSPETIARVKGGPGKRSKSLPPAKRWEIRRPPAAGATPKRGAGDAEQRIGARMQPSVATALSQFR